MKTCPHCRKEVPEKEKICQYCNYDIPEGQISPWQTGFAVLPITANSNVKPISPGFRRETDDEDDA